MVPTYLINGICLIVVNNADLASFSKLDNLHFLDIHDIANRQGNLDAVAFVVRPENDTLKALYPLAGAGSAVGAEVV